MTAQVASDRRARPFDAGSKPALTGLEGKLGDYTSRVEQLKSPDQILDELHAFTAENLPLSVLAAARLPIKSGDWEAVRLGQSLFIHKDVPKGWWEEYDSLARGKFRPILFLARSSLASYSWTEVTRMLQPIGVDRWTYDLALKYGMRDGLTCPVGGRWVVGFWSRKELSHVLTPPIRIMMVAAASFAALRLEQVTGLNANRIGSRGRLTPREIAALRLASAGAGCREIAQALQLGQETVRSHLKKAQVKLGVRNRTAAVAEALRQNFIP
jgi:DNA-binding CsgD family transcriptional regulator